MYPHIAQIGTSRILTFINLKLNSWNVTGIPSIRLQTLRTNYAFLI